MNVNVGNAFGVLDSLLLHANICYDSGGDVEFMTVKKFSILFITI